MSGHSSTQAVLVFMKLILSQSWFYLTHSIMINKCDLVMLIREGFKNKKKLVEYSTKGPSPFGLVYQIQNARVKQGDNAPNASKGYKPMKGM